MFDGLFEPKLKSSDTTMTEPLKAKRVGIAYGQGHGVEGNLYACTDGSTYYVPVWRENGAVMPQLSQTQLVLANPTGKVQDMTTRPLEGQLEVITALRDVILAGYPKAAAEERLKLG
jgi:hypothetical protein